ncbi:MAG: hypothetical protein V2A73_10260 [Pseudomonadota bacterium]
MPLPRHGERRSSGKRSGRRARESGGEVVGWSDGVRLIGTPLWCDASRSRGLSFVSSARLLPSCRHQQIIATQATIGLLTAARRTHKTARAATTGAAAATAVTAATTTRVATGGAALAVPYGRPFTLGNLRLELFPAGYSIGSASLVVDTPAARIVYAGAIGPGGGLAGECHVRACDILIVDVSSGCLSGAPQEAAAVLDWVTETLRWQRAPVLLVEPLGRAPEIVEMLGRAAIPLRAHRQIVQTIRRIREIGLALPDVRLLRGPPSPGEAVLWPPFTPLAPALAASNPPPRCALVSGAAGDHTILARAGAETGMVWADRPSRDQLLTYIEQTGASKVYLVGAEPDANLFPRSIPLGPPRQLRLLP